MGKLNRLSARKVIQKLKKFGFFDVYQKGSHLFLKNIAGTRVVTIPVHSSKDIPIGTLHSIVVKQAGLTIQEFNEA